MTGRFERLDVFLAVADTGGFTAAAQRLGVTTGAVSQAVRALEARHAVLLFTRTTRRVRLTDAGRELYDRLRPVAAEVDAALAALAGHGDAPRGRVRLTVPHAVVGRLVAPALARMRARWPRLEVEVSVSDLPVDLLADGFDAGIRLGDAVERDMVAVPLTAPLAWALVATPDHLARHGTPRTAADLVDHPAIAFRFPGSRQVEAWDLVQDGQAVRIRPPAPVVVDDRELLLAATRAGLGMALLDRVSVEDDLAAGRLVDVLPGSVPPTPGLSVYFPRRSASQAKLRALIDTLREVGAALAQPTA